MGTKNLTFIKFHAIIYLEKRKRRKEFTYARKLLFNLRRICFSSIQNTTETFHVRGIDITITSPARICENCGEIIFDEVLDDEKLKLVYRAYREQKGLLQPEEIRAIRERKNLTQEEFSKVLGFNVARYENGSLQSEEEDKRLVKISQADCF